MFVPAGVDWAVGNRDWQAFALGGVLTAGSGAAVVYFTRCRLTAGLTLRQAFLLTPLCWLTICVFASIPFILGSYGPLRDSYANAFFEAMSGITSTGSTVIFGLDRAPPGILLWRAILQWIGGIGIIATAIAILPALGVGGMQLFRTKSSDRSEKAMPRVRQIAAAIGATYLGFTGLCATSYWVAGMTPFDAIAHALTTVSTGGYSTSDLSMGNWDQPAIHWIAILFMLLGSIPFVLYVRMVRGERDPLRDSQARTFLAFVGLVVAIVAVWLVVSGHYGPADALRHSAFNIVSVITTTGFATTDYSLWGNVSVGAFFGLMFVGGCTGSTAGGIKIFRFQVTAAMLRSHFLQLLHPRGIFSRMYAGRQLTDQVAGSVVVFFALYFICYGALTIALMAFDLDFLTSASAAVASLSNVGPGLGHVIGPVGNYYSLPDGAKWLLSFGMLLGRLELFTVLMLFVPQFWRG